jgi:hypothetical protein
MAALGKLHETTGVTLEVVGEAVRWSGSAVAGYFAATSPSER